MISRSIRQDSKEYGIRLINVTDFNEYTMVDISPTIISLEIDIPSGKMCVVPYRGYTGKEYGPYDILGDSSAISWFKFDDDVVSSPLIFNEASLAENGGAGKNGILKILDLASKYSGELHESLYFNGIEGNMVDFGSEENSNSFFMGEPQNVVCSMWVNISGIPLDSENKTSRLLGYKFRNDLVGSALNTGFGVDIIGEANDLGFRVSTERMDVANSTFIDNLGVSTTDYKVGLKSSILEYNKTYHIVVFFKSDGYQEIWIDGVSNNKLITFPNELVKYNGYDSGFNTTIGGMISGGDSLNNPRHMRGWVDNFRFFSKSNFNATDALLLFNEDSKIYNY